MTPAPKRRWTAFSLRTLFVVMTMFALSLGLLGWQVKVVNDRRMMRNNIALSGAQFPAFISGNVELIRAGDQQFAISRIRQLLGDRELLVIYFPRRPATADDATEASFFPEANVFINGPEPVSE